MSCIPSKTENTGSGKVFKELLWKLAAMDLQEPLNRCVAVRNRSDRPATASEDRTRGTDVMTCPYFDTSEELPPEKFQGRRQ